MMRRSHGAAVLLALLCATGAGGATAGDRPDTVLVVGDSLAVGLQPYLAPLVAPRGVVWDVTGGRTTPEGLVRLRAELRALTPRAVLVSLGTNDGPSPARFRDRIRRALRAIPSHTCVLWADIHRPRRKGPYRPLNSVLAREARRDPRLVIVRWSRAITRHEVHLRDGIHPDTAGFDYRSRLFARALARGC
jgi:lysophospholipase L1-like esterase